MKTRKTPALDTPNARRSIRQSPRLYVAKIHTGLFIGYRKGKKDGNWYARAHDGGTKYTFEWLGIADDVADADGINILNCDQAKKAAQVWFKRKAEEDSGEVVAGAHTIHQTVDAYLKDRERVRRKELSRTRSVIETHIRPSLGHIELAKLKYGKVKTWRDGLAETLPRVRSKANVTEQQYREIDRDDADALRKRQATANRIFTVLRAALNFAHSEGWIASKAAWERITPFREVDVPKVRYLSVEECKRLIKACPEDFRALVRAALYTGCRYGELTAMRVGAFSTDTNTIHVEHSKSGKGRYIPLTAEGAQFFISITAKRSADEPMLKHSSGVRKGKAWEHSQQRYWIELACTEAEIAPMIGFHILRHTYASQLAMNGTPMPVIAALLGHSDTRMTEKHYGHLAPSYIADTLRANLPSFGFTSPHIAAHGPVLVQRAG